MAHRTVGQLSFAEGLVRERAGRNARLDRLAGLLDWAPLERLVAGIHSHAKGRPAYPPIVLLRCLLLQQWYRLSDAGLEDALLDRLSFRRFAGLGLDAEVPDHTTVCRFRRKLVDTDLHERLLAEVNRQLDAKGLVLRTGTLIDASLIAADARPPAKGDPVGGGSDPDARWAARKAKSCFGYKAHAAVDENSQLIRAAVMTPASTGDSPLAESLIQGDEAIVLADRGYASDDRRTALAALGIADGIMKKRRQGRPLSEADQAHNLVVARRRHGVERVWGTLKRWYGAHRARYRSLAKNHLHLQLLAAAYNLKRALVLAA